jgi:hypothetical protein
MQLTGCKYICNFRVAQIYLQLFFVAVFPAKQLHNDIHAKWPLKDAASTAIELFLSPWGFVAVTGGFKSVSTAGLSNSSTLEIKSLWRSHLLSSSSWEIYILPAG